LVVLDSLSSKTRDHVIATDYDSFSKLVGARAFEILMVDALQSGGMGTPGYVTYGAIVPEFSETFLLKNGWSKSEDLASLKLVPGTKFRNIYNFNHNLYSKTIDGRPVALICSPYGDSQYLGEVAYIVFVSSEYDVVTK